MKSTLSQRNNSHKIQWTAQAIAEIAVMTAVLEAGKIALSFLPNIEIVSVLILLYTRHFGRRVIPVILLFVALETLIWGFGLWIIMYLYVWFILAILAFLVRKTDSLIIWAGINGIFGLLFGGLCAIVYLFIGGPKTAFAWWIAGLPWDFVHCAGNIATALILFKPLDSLLTKYGRHRLRLY